MWKFNEITKSKLLDVLQGGTESILAMRCYKKAAQQRGKRGGSLSKAHTPLVEEAAEYFNMNVVEIETINESLSYEMLKNFVTKNSTIKLLLNF